MEGGEGAESTTPSTDDDVLREQSFKRPQGLNLDSFMVATSSSDDATPNESRLPNAETGNDDAAQASLAAEHRQGANEQHEEENAPM